MLNGSSFWSNPKMFWLRATSFCNKKYRPVQQFNRPEPARPLAAQLFRMDESFQMAGRNRWDEEVRRLVQSPFRLRFELGENSLSNVTQTVPRFIQALDRARNVAEAVFLDSAIVAVVGSSATKTKGDDFRTLRDLGFTAPMIGEWHAPRYLGDGVCLWK